ncbi:hypothetical protein MtrunA17_Chr8g0372281 [Medicago truncatula]|uniref:Uncharacterized protein n=1 Tax=Medicago truncatula TaxID=3880 RepID=A0A396GTS5_MEDTR|nr:hypothetical protein MtrunA17_Chr8g0372281 [Medicago truncatula]
MKRGYVAMKGMPPAEFCRSGRCWSWKEDDMGEGDKTGREGRRRKDERKEYGRLCCCRRN